MAPVGAVSAAGPLADVVASYRLVDLSVLLSEEMPTWPGHMLFSHKIHNWFAPVAGPGQPLRSTAEYCTWWYTIDEHYGTHFDAPAHFVPPPNSGLPGAMPSGGLTGEKVSLDRLRGPAAVVDVRKLTDHAENGVSPRITPELLQAWEARYEPFARGDVAIARTGWDAYWAPSPEGDKFCWRPVVLKDFPGWPAPSVEAIDYLYDRGVRLFCTDAPSIGPVEEPASAHRAGLERDLLFVECLANLAELPPRGAYFNFMPLKIANSSGGNGRAAALVPRDE
jgi:kynurenine formamidase